MLEVLSGKKVGKRLYLHVDQLSRASTSIRSLVDLALAVEGRSSESYNMLRLEPDHDEVAFLHYPSFGSEAFPSLATSERVHIPSRLARLRDYRASLNPPILHRTELFLEDDHPVRPQLAALTRACEQIGLFENTSIIGFRRQWMELIKQKGYSLHGFELRPVANDEEFGGTTDPFFDIDVYCNVIQRHRTALSRQTLSAPVQALLRDGLLRGETSFFDYGCGKGDDLAALAEAGIEGRGWDPYFRNEAARSPAAVVNIGFVINVIENRDERAEALLRAFELSTQTLAVAAMVANSSEGYGKPFADGVVTSRNTFQKYYTQAELQHFIESTLDEEAYPAAPGVFYVFKDRSVEQMYLSAKSSNRARLAQATIAAKRERTSGAEPRRLATQPARSLDPRAARCLETLWRQLLLLGREPEEDEIPNIGEVVEFFGTSRKAIRACLAAHDQQAFAHAQASRRDDITVMLALRRFERRRSINEAHGTLRRDVQALFGSFKAAEAAAATLLFSVQDTAAIRSDCELAATQGLGYLDAGHSLQLHTSLVERLPPRLRIYIGCATSMVGDVRAFDLVKAHINSGKVTLIRYDDFIESPLPTMSTRVKVRLRDQDVDVFEYSEEGPYRPPVLYYKSRYVNEDFPNYPEQLQFEQALDDLGLFDLSGYGPPASELTAKLRAYRYEIRNYTLSRSRDIPASTAPCGSRFKFSDLIECGETWKHTQVDNRPRQPDTYNALADLARLVLEPVADYFGAPRLTYCFASSRLTQQIRKGIAPRLDQHSSCERNRSGKPICERGGSAVDFIVDFENMREVARWIASNCEFDRLYFYGDDRPLHVSIGPGNTRSMFEIKDGSGRRIPKRIAAL